MSSLNLEFVCTFIDQEIYQGFKTMYCTLYPTECYMYKIPLVIICP